MTANPQPWLIADWYVHDHIARLLTEAGLGDHSRRIAALPPLTDRPAVDAAIVTIKMIAQALWQTFDPWESRSARDAWDSWNESDSLDVLNAQALWHATAAKECLEKVNIRTAWADIDLYGAWGEWTATDTCWTLAYLRHGNSMSAIERITNDIRQSELALVARLCEVT